MKFVELEMFSYIYLLILLVYILTIFNLKNLEIITYLEINFEFYLKLHTFIINYIITKIHFKQ